jgi:hypothetical protein
MVAEVFSVISTLLFGHFPDAYLDIMVDSLKMANSSERVQKAVDEVKDSLRLFRKAWSVLDFA